MQAEFHTEKLEGGDHLEDFGVDIIKIYLKEIRTKDME
jgi:hypothetical protein